MLAKDLLNWGLRKLKDSKKEENIAYICMKYIDKNTKLLFSKTNIPKTKEEKYKKAIEEYIKNDLPIPLFFKSIYFYNLKLDISKGCFMPRFETEQLVDELSNYLREIGHYPKKVIDICTGIGAIPIALKTEFPMIKKIDAYDVNDVSIKSAKSSNIKLKTNVNFFTEDFFNYKPKEKYDVVIMNPPYIGEDETLEESVLKNDPRNALFSKDEGLFFYKELINKINLYVEREKFIICFEIGFKQKDKILKLVKESFHNYKIQIIKDYQKLDRIVIIEGEL